MHVFTFVKTWTERDQKSAELSTGGVQAEMCPWFPKVKITSSIPQNQSYEFIIRIRLLIVTDSDSIKDQRKKKRRKAKQMLNINSTFKTGVKWLG